MDHPKSLYQTRGKDPLVFKGLTAKESVQLQCNKTTATHDKYKTEKVFNPFQTNGIFHKTLNNNVWMVHLGDNCIQNFHLGRYIVRYTFYGDARAEP